MLYHHTCGLHTPSHGFERGVEVTCHQCSRTCAIYFNITFENGGNTTDRICNETCNHCSVSGSVCPRRYNIISAFNDIPPWYASRNIEYSPMDKNNISLKIIAIGSANFRSSAFVLGFQKQGLIHYLRGRAIKRSAKWWPRVNGQNTKLQKIKYNRWVCVTEPTSPVAKVRFIRSAIRFPFPSSPP